MIRFRYHYRENILAYQTEAGSLWYQVEEQFPGSFGSLGFSLNEGWMTFTVQTSKIKVFYKQIESHLGFGEPSKVAYFKKDLPKQEEVIFEFASQDQVEKREGRWVKKGGSYVS